MASLSRSKVQEYQESLIRVDQALKRLQERVGTAVEKEAKAAELIRLREDLVKALSEAESGNTEQKPEQIYVGTQLTKGEVGALCNGYYETDQQWYPALLEDVDELDSSALLLFLGFNERIRVPFSFVQVIPPVDVTMLIEGSQVEALYARDGKWHPATIEGLNGDLVCVKYQKWPTKENLKLPFIRLVSSPQKRSLTDREVFEVPDKLKINPNDPEDVRKQKKKKTKALKKAWRQSQHEKASQAYQNSWKTFRQTTEVSSLAKVHKSSIFRSPETVMGKVGVTGSGQGITHFQEKIKWKDAFPKKMDDSDST